MEESNNFKAPIKMRIATSQQTIPLETGTKLKYHIIYRALVSLGGLGVKCSPRVPVVAGSNQAEVDGLFQDVKILSTSPPGGTKLGVPSLRFQAR